MAALMGEAHNLILVGGIGTGITHLATALDVAAIHHGKSIRLPWIWSTCWGRKNS